MNTVTLLTEMNVNIMAEDKTARARMRIEMPRYLIDKINASARKHNNTFTVELERIVVKALVEKK